MMTSMSRTLFSYGHDVGRA